MILAVDGNADGQQIVLGPMQHAHAGRNIFGWYAFESIAVCRDGAVCKWCPLLRQRDDVFAGIVGSRRRTSTAAIRLHTATTIASPAMPDSCASSTWVSHRASRVHAAHTIGRVTRPYVVTGHKVIPSNQKNYQYTLQAATTGRTLPKCAPTAGSA